MTLANISRFILCLRTAFGGLSANVSGASPRQFLAQLQPALLTGIIEACARSAISRRERLLALNAQLYPWPEPPTSAP